MKRLWHALFHGRKTSYPEVVLDICGTPSYFCLKCMRRYYV